MTYTNLDMSDIDPMLEKHDAPPPDVNPETDVVMQSYPSPTVDGQDNNPFYHTTPRQDQQPQSDLSHHHDDQGQLEEPPTPRHSGRQPMSSAEELQLAAQLSQGLAHGLPMMDPTDEQSLQHVMAQHDLDQHDPDLQHQADQLNHDHEQLHHDPLPQHDGLPPHDEHGHEHIHEHIHSHDQDIPQSHSDQQQLQHHDEQQQANQHHQAQHQYIPEQHQQQQQPHLQPAAPMDHMPQQFPPMTDNSIPPRKRSKVSRACDECRRKKVKCDAPSEGGDEPCSNCRRSNMRCLFSRIPQKRGPSKGYIKELADRIHSIEGKLNAEGASAADLNELLNGTRRDTNDIFGSADGRKRPYSSISGADFGTPPDASRQSTFSEPRAIQPYQPTPERYRPPYSANGLAPTPGEKDDSETPSRPAAVMDGMDLDLSHLGQARELDETLFAAYLAVIHPCFPVLTANKSRLEAQLAQCSSILRDAFIDALHGTVQSLPSFNTDGLYRELLSSAVRLIADWETDSSPRSHIANLVHLQTLVLIAISADNYGPSSLKGEHGGPAKAATLGRAVGLAYSMRLHLSQVGSNLDVELDPDSDDNVATRAWWTLVMLDRWNAISTASPLFIPNASVVILPGLLGLLGENVYHLARLSNILGHFSPVALAPPQAMAFDSGAAPLLSSFFNLSMELFREVLPVTIAPATHPILHSVYWHYESQREDATSLLKELLDTPTAPSNWDNLIRDRIAEQVRPTTAHSSMEATASQSLQHLADLATATEVEASTKLEKSVDFGSLRANDYEHSSFDPQPLTRAGYLYALVETRPATAK
ncbi:hypothetical protein JX266_004300 [Neoarthrinium moseri]|nr:hypothetical protein JX266_004300 [Neoarthrinium moseri]